MSLDEYDDSDFEYKEETENGKEGIVYFGQKGAGKTSAAYLLEGKKVVLSFDGKSLRVKELMRPDDGDITVLDASKYISHWKNKMTEGGKKTVEYCKWLLNETTKRGGCDWVIIDGLEMLIEAAEMAMRFDHKIGPFDGFANMGFWKDRRANIRAIHDSAFACATKGVVWTSYIDKDEIVNNATLVKKTDIPKWMDIVMYYTDAVVKCQIDTIEGKERFRLYVLTSKIRRFKTGDVLDVTDVLTLSDAKPVGAVPESDKVNLDKAIKRKKAKYSLDKCPQCSADTANAGGVIHCPKCDWVHEDEGD